MVAATTRLCTWRIDVLAGLEATMSDGSQFRPPWTM
jgi:hypothetical protein